MQIDVAEADFRNPMHRAGIIDVLDSYASDPVGGGEPLTAEVRERLLPLLSDHPSALVLLATTESRVVGLAICFLGLSTFRARPLLNIHDLAVLPECRGKGVGRGLLTAVESEARKRGCCKLTLEAQDDNLRALGLYKSFGFSDFVVGDSEPTRFLAKPL